MEIAKKEIFKALLVVSKKHYEADILSQETVLMKQFSEVDFAHDESYKGQSFSVPTFLLIKPLIKKVDKKAMKENGVKLAIDLSKLLLEEFKDSQIVENIEPSYSENNGEKTYTPYINVFLKVSFIANIISDIKTGDYLKLINKKTDKIMIEYSQPNTHKLFHVGHMRNASLGNSLVKLFKFQGYEVTAVNYIGDVGTHIAKCLWYYLYHFEKKSKKIEENIPEGKGRVEFLGECYQNACIELDFSYWTKFVFPGYFTAQITSIKDHPKNPKWKVLEIDNKTTVVCGGTGYQLNDIVAYAPVGSKKGPKIITETDKQGVISHGFILSETELNISKKKDQIYIFPKGTEPGIELTEYERLKDCPDVKSVSEEMKLRNGQVRSLLKSMEEKEKEITELWELTRKWSIEDFKEIYEWTDSEFDFDFHESDVGDESKEIIKQAYDEGKLKKSDGAIGLDCGKLGFCVLLTSDGTGLYATKDIALAKRKFEEFKIDRSIYVVDAAQTLHFQQVFKVLNHLGFKQSSKCFHLAYGIVTLPNGKMSSRKGTVITFSQLKDQLLDNINKEFLEKYKGDENWSDQQIKDAARIISVATIKYGMLKQDPAKDIIFSLNEWIAKTGNTGPYLLYAYARIKSILREVERDETVKPDFSLLVHEKEKRILLLLHQFLTITSASCEQYKPSNLCNYLYTLAKSFSSMYEAVSIKKAESEQLKVTRLEFVLSISIILKTGLNLLGIETLERM